MNRPKRLSEVLGLWAGGVVAPILTAGTLIREARIFHPRGIYFHAEVEPTANVPAPYIAIAEGLAQNDSLMRLSAGISNMESGVMPDLLGVSVRFNTAADAGYMPHQGSQDLLMATSQSLLSIPIALFETDQRNFLANIYYGMSPFELGNQPDMRLRIVPLTQLGKSGTDRYDMIRDAVASGEVVFRLEASPVSAPGQWFPLVRIRLQNEVALDDRTTRFWPFRTGQGIRPQGFVQYMRPVPYLTSQWARSAMGMPTGMPTGMK